jgi:kumamolisin
MARQTYVSLPGTLRRLPANAQRVAEISPKEPIEVSIYLKPSTDPRPADAALSGTDHQEASPARRAALHQDDIKLVADFAADNGLKITEVNPEQHLVKIKGPASKMQAAFKIHLAIYHDRKQQFRDFIGFVHLPKEVAPVVQAMLGLDNREAAQPSFVMKERAIEGDDSTRHSRTLQQAKRT